MSDYEILIHYWPETPNLREVRIRVYGNTEFSMFLNKDEISHFAKVLFKTAENIVE